MSISLLFTGVALGAGVVLVFWLACLVAVLVNPDRYRNGTQLIWVLVVLLAGPLGGLLYLLLGRAGRRVDREPPPPRAARGDAIRHPWDP
ncbi:MAG: PLDc N-terminal domain-containing protein [Acidimicrobiales bacterium]